MTLPKRTSCGCVHRTRPWGWYETIDGTHENYKIKKIFVNPNKRFSLQYHNERQEHWIVLEGSGLALVNNYEEWITPGKHFNIPQGSRHRLTAGDSGILIMEVQYGSTCTEDDIVRLEDDFGRVGMQEYSTD